VRFRILGPVEIVSGSNVLVSSRRQERCLLAVLLLDLNHAVPAERLTDLLWDGGPPDGARATLRSHVSRVRSLLAAAGAADVTLASVGGGYRLTADPSAVDAHRFRELVEYARATTAPGERNRCLRSAADRWRGRALEDAASDSLRNRLCADLEELRLAATEHLAFDSLAAGQLEHLLPELARAVGAHPGRETLAELYMRALHQTGRRADALVVFDRTRAYLADELGGDPGSSLHRLHRAMLQDQLPQSGPAADHWPSIPKQLPPDVAGFTGRGEGIAATAVALVERG
jgi:DNA-binding SARP family transcriptional activator